MKLLFVSALFVTSALAYLDCSSTTMLTCAADPILLQAASVLLGSCTSEGATLQASLEASTNQVSFSAAWETFCTGTCATGITVLQPQHDCCVGLFGLYHSMNNLKAGCKISTQNAGRRCGAELFSLGAVQCAATNAVDCANLGTCQWVDAAHQCLFKPTRPVLDAMCTKCNRDYFQNFTTGGMNPIGAYSKLAAVFDFACSKVDDTYCLLSTADDIGFHMPNELTPTDMASLCAPTAAATTKRRCYRSMTTVTARGLVREARAAFENCSSGDAACQEILGGTLALASALERSAASVCSYDSSTTANCFGVGASLMADRCFLNTVGTSNCSGCDSNVTAAATAAGCCGPTFATSGVPILMKSPMPGRVIFASGAGASKNVNMTTATLNAVALSMAKGSAAGIASANTFAAVGTCPSFAPQFSQWAASANAAPCVRRAFSRTYDVSLYTRAAAFDACANKQVVLDAILSDIAVATGATPAQFKTTSTSSASNGDLVVRITVTADTAAEIAAMDTSMIGKPGAMYFTTTGREIVFACPTMLPLQIATNFAINVEAVTVVGEEPLPTTPTPSPTPTTTPPPTVLAGNGASSSAAFAAASVLGLAVAALALW